MVPTPTTVWQRLGSLHPRMLPVLRSRFCVAVERLSDWRPTSGWIDALELGLSGAQLTDPRG